MKRERQTETEQERRHRLAVEEILRILENSPEDENPPRRILRPTARRRQRKRERED